MFFTNLYVGLKAGGKAIGDFPQCHVLERFRVAGVSGAGSGQAAVFGDGA